MDKEMFLELVNLYASGQISQDELHQLRNLLDDPYYRATMENLLEHQLHNATYDQEDFPELYTIIQQRIDSRISMKTSVYSIQSSLKWIAAAVIILLVSISGYLWLTSNRPDKERELVEQVISPGKNGAILTLADGTELILDSLEEGNIATQAGAIVKLENGQLVYMPDGTTGNEMNYNSMKTPKGRQFQLQLPDGTMVWLNAASSIRYPAVFSGKERRVEITGEVYFEVAKNATMPFKVTVNNQAEVQVLGTSFNVNGYLNEREMCVTLLEGSVRFGAGGNDVQLKPGQQARYADVIQVKNEVDMDQVMAWRNGLFNFNGADVYAVMRQLERWYDIDVRFEGEIPNRQFGGELSKDLDLAQIIKILNKVEIDFRLEGRTLIVGRN